MLLVTCLSAVWIDGSWTEIEIGLGFRLDTCHLLSTCKRKPIVGPLCLTTMVISGKPVPISLSWFHVLQVAQGQVFRTAEDLIPSSCTYTCDILKRPAVRSHCSYQITKLAVSQDQIFKSPAANEAGFIYVLWGLGKHADNYDQSGNV